MVHICRVRYFRHSPSNDRPKAACRISGWTAIRVLRDAERFQRWRWRGYVREVILADATTLCTDECLRNAERHVYIPCRYSLMGLDRKRAWSETRLSGER